MSASGDLRRGLETAIEAAVTAEAFASTPAVRRLTSIRAKEFNDLEPGVLYVLIMPGIRYPDVEDRAGMSLSVAPYIAVAIRSEEADRDEDFETAELLMEELEVWLADRANAEPATGAGFLEFVDLPRTRATLSDELLNADNLVYIVTAPRYQIR